MVAIITYIPQASKFSPWLLVLACQLVTPNFAHGQAVSMKVGDSDLYPELRLGYSQSDNAFRTDSDEIDSGSVLVAPRLRWVADKATTRISATYQGEFAAADEAILDYTDHSLNFGIASELSKRTRVSGSLGYRLDHEDLGDNLSRNQQGNLLEQNELTDFSINLELGYGATRARGNITTGINYSDRSYENNESLTAGNNRAAITPYLTFSLRASADTRVFFDIRYTDLDFDLVSGDGSRIGAYVGASWDISGKSGGSAKIGQIRRSYDGLGTTDTDLGMVLTGYYEFNDFSRVNLRAERSYADSIQAGADVVQDDINLGWSYRWSSRLSHQLYVSRVGRERTCPAEDDATINYGLEMSLLVKRWLSLGATASATTRQSDQCDAGDADNDYDRRDLGIFTKITL